MLTFKKNYNLDAYKKDSGKGCKRTLIGRLITPPIPLQI